MLDKFIFGRYIKGDSWIHRLDPRTKLMASFFYIAAVFLANNMWTYVVSFVFVMLAVVASKVPFQFFINGVKPLIWLILFTVILQILFTGGADPIWQWGIINITRFGIINGIFIFCRFILIIFMSTLMTLTTPPLGIADAIESLLQPLKVIHFPVHELALMLSIALRFVPTLMDEAQKIMNAQRARGVEFGEGNLFQQMKAVVPILVPLFVSSFERADDLATAMEARGYHGGEGRTKYRILKWQSRDIVAGLCCAGLLVVLVVLRA
ncbi:energy-coupling factor transporter transmembrane component T family protein [Bavariicoccus seileri]|uniref:energy-coupling factor transporter transmembrane component T family protein n=2 Tax=Bavariicoccus seileri TaxID=549685 RepID=UPI0003B53E8C|nr:energy-coupling factor transporter transmembrane protein EcfT [Bavariicoccus seileri]